MGTVRLQHGENGIDGVALSMPAIVGRGGVEGSVPIRLSEQEKEALLKSSETLKAVINESL